MSPDWRTRARRKIVKYGPRYWERFCTLERMAKSRYFNVVPGDGLNYAINKQLCGEFAQGSLDSQHKTSSVREGLRNEAAIHYCFETPLNKKESKMLERDLLNYTTLEDVLDMRKCRAFVVVVSMINDDEIFVCRLKDWPEVVRRQLGSFSNLYYCTDVRGVCEIMGDLAGAINFSNILTEFEKKHPNTDLTIVLLNCFFLNENERPCAINRYGMLRRRSFLSRIAFEKIPKNKKLDLQKEQDDLMENYVRIMMQQTPLVGTNFNHFQLFSSFGPGPGPT